MRRGAAGASKTAPRACASRPSMRSTAISRTRCRITSQQRIRRARSPMSPTTCTRCAARETLRYAGIDPELRKDFELILRRLDDSWQRLEQLIAGMLPTARRMAAQPAAALGRSAGAEDRGEPRSDRERGARAAPRRRCPPSFIEHASATAHGSPRITSTRPNYLTSRAGAIRPRALVAHARGPAALARFARLALTEKGTARQTLTKNEGIPADSVHGKALRDDWVERAGAHRRRTARRAERDRRVARPRRPRQGARRARRAGAPAAARRHAAHARFSTRMANAITPRSRARRAAR